MNQEFHAIYKDGVLRPLTPLELPESTEVVGMIVRTKSDPAVCSPPPPSELQSQQSALNAMFEAVDKIPQTAATDGLSGRDHDKILYTRPS